MTTVKQVCLGVAVAGVIAGTGSALATGVAYAETPGDSSSSADAGSSDSPTSKSAREDKRDDKTEAADEADSPRDAAKATEPRRKRSSEETETGDSKTDDSTSDPEETGDQKTGPEEDDSSEESEPAQGSAAPEVVGTETQPSRAPAETRLTDSADTDAAPAVPEPEVLASYAPARKSPDLPAPALPTPLLPTAAAGISTLAGSTTRSRTATADLAAQIVDPTTQHVLVIGVDGTNLSRVLDDPANTKFFQLMDTGVTSASTIVGHTTISNPSWTAILTGVWDTKSGVINNVFTPWTYNSWPTVFNQLESANPDLETKAIADWQVVADIAGAGSHPADEVVVIEAGPDDPVHAAADAAVTAEAISSILGTDPEYADVPNFLFTYLVQVDEAGHQYGGASPEYAAAIQRTNTNVGLILDAVARRELATGEDWTIVMVTDHGHQPQLGVGHGFQSPYETSTFVIVDGPDFDDGQVNLRYSIVDITPTVVSLFGLDPRADADGVPLTDLEGSQVDPVDLHQALNDAIDMYGWPDIQTNLALSLRTIFASIPYFVDTAVTDITAELQAVAGQGIFLVSDVAALAIFPVDLIGDALYAVTNLIAQVVGRLTGAGVIPPSTSTLDRDGQPYPWVLA